jgi:hypothetical protein
MRGYFEGWYFKMVTADENESVVLIPGVSFEREGRNSHAFIQLARSGTMGSRYFRYDIGGFSFARDSFKVIIGESVFQRDGLTIDARDESGYVVGNLKFSNHHPWPVNPFSPGAMGPFAFVPFMQCYHGVTSLDHSISGCLQIDGCAIDFEGGRGYMEKDWGKSFPLYHIWLQTNHFDIPGTSLMLSVARVPWLSFSFNGFIAGFLHEGHLFRFASYTGAHLEKVKLEHGNLEVIIKSRRHLLEINVPVETGVELKAPIAGQMSGKLRETLQASAYVRFSRIEGRRQQVLFEDTGRKTALEIAGRTERLWEMFK